MKYLGSIVCVLTLIAVNVYALGKAPDFNAFKLEAQKDVNAAKAEFNGKVTGLEAKVDDLQADLKANGSAIAGFNNKINQVNKTVSTSTGRDNITTNDSELMERYIAAMEKMQEMENKRASKADTRFMVFLSALITSLFGVIGKQALDIRSTNKRLFRMIEKDEEAEEKRMSKVLDIALNKK